MVSILASSAVDRVFIDCVMVSMLASSAVDRVFIDCVMVSMLASSAVDRVFERWSSEGNDYKMGVYCFTVNGTPLRSKNNYLFALNQNNVSEWSDTVV